MEDERRNMERRATDRRRKERRRTDRRRDERRTGDRRNGNGHSSIWAGVLTEEEREAFSAAYVRLFGA